MSGKITRRLHFSLIGATKDGKEYVLKAISATPADIEAFISVGPADGIGYDMKTTLTRRDIDIIWEAVS